jgi:hypothetical protein
MISIGKEHTGRRCTVSKVIDLSFVIIAFLLVHEVMKLFIRIIISSEIRRGVRIICIRDVLRRFLIKVVSRDLRICSSAADLRISPCEIRFNRERRFDDKVTSGLGFITFDNTAVQRS